ncbi:ParB N-terminal domain-containing protein [Paragemmobacter aquarius]|uniref:ParB N-terminal domain-containing protein n=1 Tax=Paragemmobacter aquarius TaxID=2169400 RepID=UPI00131EFCAE|nr:ParB N-terminal domain-containing protein [Gemmobacter aquarius]
MSDTTVSITTVSSPPGSRVAEQKRGVRQRLLAWLSNRFQHHVPACTDLRGVTSDPMHAAYLWPESPFLIDVASGACLGLHSVAFPMSPRGQNPFVQTVRAMDKGLDTYAGSALYAYYERFRPATAAAAIGVSPQVAHPDLLRPASAATLPWDFRDPAAAQAFWTGVCAHDYRQHGFDLTFSDGWKAWGPATEVAGAAEFTRLARLHRSIKSRGYLRHPAHDGDIQGVILRHHDQTRILLTAGQHRAAVLAALGHETLPVRLTASVIDRSGVAHWPNVKRGIFSQTLALSVFDRIFAGRQPYGQASNRLRTVR